MVAPYEPRGAAAELIACREPEVLIEGPAGTGKTRAVLEKIHFAMTKYPGSRALITRKTRASMTESALVTFESKVLPGGSPLKAGPQRQTRHSYKYPNGSELIVGGMDNPDRIMSTEYDIIAAFEATELTEDDAEKLTSRLRNGKMPYQQFVCDCNPGPPSHWLNQRAVSGRMKRMLSRHTDNPSVTPAYLRVLSNLTGVRRLRLFEGRWAQAEGVVYEGWDPTKHLIEPFAIPDDWRRFRCIDFGYTNPFVCQWWAMDGDGRLYLYRELYHTKRLVSKHAERIVELSVGENIEATICDHDAEDRATLEAGGIGTICARKEVGRGIQAVANRLQSAGDDKPRLFVMRDALVEADPMLIETSKPRCTEQEFDGYVWTKSKDGRPVKEDPVKVHDHGMDAMRYMVMHLDHGEVVTAEYVGAAAVQPVGEWDGGWE